MPDQLVRALLAPPRVRVVAAVTTETAREGARRHGTVGAATVALGRALTAGVLLATLTKGEERVQVNISGDGPINLVTVDANDAGDVRGRVLPRGVAAPLGTQARPQVSAAIGRGTVDVVRDLGLKEQYRGSAAIVTGEIDEDVEAYLRQSEQLDSALGCEVVVDEGGWIRQAGGLLVQAMPGGEPELIRAVQHQLRTQVLYHGLAGGAPPSGPLELARVVLSDLPIQVLDERPVRFHCRCSAERVRGMLELLDADELAEMIGRGEPAEVICEFCRQSYQVELDELARLREQVAGRGPRQPN
jgi:molecular chaperone Hsp33